MRTTTSSDARGRREVGICTIFRVTLIFQSQFGALGEAEIERNSALGKSVSWLLIEVYLMLKKARSHAPGEA